MILIVVFILVCLVSLHTFCLCSFSVLLDFTHFLCLGWFISFQPLTDSSTFKHSLLQLINITELNLLI